MADIVKQLYRSKKIESEGSSSIEWVGPYHIGTISDYVQVPSEGDTTVSLTNKLNGIESSIQNIFTNKTAADLKIFTKTYGVLTPNGTVQDVLSAALPANYINPGFIVGTNNNKKIVASNLTTDDATTLHDNITTLRTLISNVNNYISSYNNLLKLDTKTTVDLGLVGETEYIKTLTFAGGSPTIMIESNFSSSFSKLALNSANIYNTFDTGIQTRNLCLSPGVVTTGVAPDEIENSGDIELVATTEEVGSSIVDTGSVLRPMNDGLVSLGDSSHKWLNLQLKNQIRLNNGGNTNSVIYQGIPDNTHPERTILILDGGDAGYASSTNSNGWARLNLKTQNDQASRLYPETDNKMALGNSGNRFTTIYLGAAPDINSDKKIKRNINLLSPKYIQLFKNLIPVSYQLINESSGCTHVGFIAQDVEQAMQQVGLTSLDFAGFCKDTLEDGTETYSLRYSEFIAINTAVIQQQQKTIEDLAQRISALEAKIN